MSILSNREATIVIGLLVEQLGGEAILTGEQVRRADDLEIESIYSPVTMSTTIRATRKQPTLQGEIVTAEPQSIEPPHDEPDHDCARSWFIDQHGIYRCSACQAPL